MNLKEKIITKAVYFPVLGLFYGLTLFFRNSKHYNKLLQEKHAIIYMMFSHIFVAEVVCLILFCIIHGKR